MIDAPLPFERVFLQWADRSGIESEKLELPIGRSSASTTAYRLRPTGPVRQAAITLHGAGNDAFFAWIGLFKHLLQAGVEVLTFHLPGHGRSNTSRFSSEAARNAFQSAVSFTVERQPNLPIHAIGVSLGGAVLLSALPDIPGLTTAALIVAPLRIEFSARAVANEIGMRAFRHIVREREHYGLTGLIPSFGPFKRNAYPLRLMRTVPRGPFGYIRALNEELAGMNLETAARRCGLPVLLVYGTSDQIVPVEQGDRLASILKLGKLVRIDGGTHLSTPLETETNRQLLAWIGIDR